MDNVIIDALKNKYRDFDKIFIDNDTCLEWLKNTKYPNGIHCPKCQKITKYYRIKRRSCYSCEFCRNQIYPKSETIFKDARLSHLRLWFKAVSFMAATRCGVSSRELSYELGVTVKAGWRIWYQIKLLMDDKKCR